MKNNNNHSKFSETFNSMDGTELKELFRVEIETLRTLIQANDRNYSQRFDAIAQATQQALAAADRATSKAEMAAEKRFESVNEFRSTLADQQRNLMPRQEAELMIKSINEKVDALNLVTINRQGQSSGIGQGMGYIVGVIGVVSAVIAIIFRFAG
jgi:hypothetical protein